MSVEDIRNHMLLRADDATRQYVQGARAGIVDSYDPAEYAVRVRVQPEDTLSGWMKIKSAYVGNGFGMQVGPAIGDVVDVHHQEGDIDAGFVTLGHFNDQSRPLPVPSGEMWITHKSGTFFRLMNDGTIQAKGDMHLDGNLFVTQQISDLNGAYGTLDTLRQLYNVHRHTGVGVGGGTSAITDHPDLMAGP